MGCDIHVHLEFADKREDSIWWQTLAYQGLNWERCYDLFAIMAGVRNYDDVRPVVARRGVPTNLGGGAIRHYYLRANNEYAKDREPGFITIKEAQKYVDRGYSKIRDTKGRSVHKDDLITHPDWHSASWMTLTELRKVNLRVKWKHAGLKATIAAMAALEKMGYATRIIFWFDN
jgi:hypothetical protein